MLMALAQQKLVNAEKAAKGRVYVCPICHEVVILKNGPKMIAHFAHHAASECVGSEGETQLHLKGKQQLLQDLVAYYPKIKLEVYLIDLKQRPDLLTGEIAFEYQCSPITNLRLKERVQGYQSREINSIWILGMDYFKKSLHAYAVLRFLRYQANVGFYLLFLDPKQHCYYLKYRIVQINQHIVSKLKRFYSYAALIKFMQQPQLVNYSNVNLIKIVETIETKIRWQDVTMIKLQQACYQNGHLLTGCPLIVHYPQQMAPILNRNWLAWKIKMILYLENQHHGRLSELYQLIECDEFLFLKNLVNPGSEFVQLLQQAHYVKIEGQKVSLNKNFTWYRDTYDKIDAIKNKKRRNNYDNSKASQS